MKRDEPDLPATVETRETTVEPDLASASPGQDPRAANRLWWWLRAIQVRLRFLLIVLVAAAAVSQWQVLRGIWDRTLWRIGGRSSSGAVSSSHEYFCPMDPGVLSAWPAICPICNMDLVPRRKMDAQLLPEGVVARMQLSPYRIQLAGIRTSAVEPRALQYDLTYTGLLRSDESTQETSPPNSLGFEVNVSSFDAELFSEPRPVLVKSLNSVGPTVSATARLIDGVKSRQGSNFVVRVKIALDDATSLPVGSLVTATVAIPGHALLVAQAADHPRQMSEQVLSVPESAVIDRGNQRLVYVETMPGQFDGVAVEVGRRCGAFYPVLKGLQSGQRVATAGAFLIDAETRLNPSLAAGYFGANRSATIPTPPQPSSPDEPKRRATPTLSPEDRTLADQQRICPVTELPLNSMGGPVPVEVAGRKVFICCVGCEARLKQEPQKYLARLPAQ